MAATKLLLPKPMLAIEYDGPGRSVADMIVQPKLDGVRLLASSDGARMWTRQGSVIEPGAFPALRACIAALKLPAQWVLDGEMYTHGASFEDVVGRFKRRQEPGLTYCVYDVLDASAPEAGTAARLRAGRRAFADGRRAFADGRRAFADGRRAFADGREACRQGERVKWVDALGSARSHDEALALMDAALSQGYEGIVLRHPGMPYESGKRSAALVKLKPHRTDEFEVVAVEEAKGKDAGTPVFVCRTAADPPQTFRARPVGTMQERGAYWQAYLRAPGAWARGKRVTVRYQSLTVRGVPRFPVALAVRDYE